jgi:hypothetical protein
MRLTSSAYLSCSSGCGKDRDGHVDHGTGVDSSDAPFEDRHRWLLQKMKSIM